MCYLLSAFTINFMKSILHIILFFLTILALTSCKQDATQNTPATTPTTIKTPTPDPCAPQNIYPEVEKINKLMREFDDASLLASNTPRENLHDPISDLQKIRRNAEDLKVPACLSNLKSLQLVHMNTVITTMIAFLNGQDQETLKQGIALARQQHDAYTLELAKQLGFTIIAPTAGPTATDRPLPTETSIPTESSTEVVAPQAENEQRPIVVNPGPTTVNLRETPALGGNPLGTLDVGMTAYAIGRSADGLWFQIEIPTQSGQTAWVYAALVQISGLAEDLPVTAP